MAEYGGMIFESDKPDEAEPVTTADPHPATPSIQNPYPKPMLDLDEDKIEKVSIWLDQWIQILDTIHQDKVTQWTAEEKAYRALSEGPKSIPFEGACGDVVPAIAMAVDPVQARLSTGIFKADPVFRLKPLKKSMAEVTPALEQFIEYYQRHKVHLRQISAPRMIELVKHGTMVFKTIYDRDTYAAVSYDADWNPVKKPVTRFSGPRTVGVNLDDFYFPPFYQFVQDCPIVAERIRMTWGQLKKAEAAKKLANCDKIEGQTLTFRDQFETEQSKSVNIQDPTPSLQFYDMYELFECWFDYDIDGDGIPEKMVATYHRPSRTLLQLRYNWYHHQLKPYTVIPYTVSANSILGIGLSEMGRPFQEQLTGWHRLAMDNAYLANIRMFIAQKDTSIENRPALFAGRVFRVEDPKKDLIPFAMADTYPSTINERQNLFGLMEKRTGVSDYLTGRESSIVGSNATATSTIALINEGTKRVEETLENIRNGYAEILEMWIAIWIQYGLDGLDDVVFADDEVGQKVRDFFNSVTIANLHGSLAVDLSVTDAANNRVAQQQMQLAIIQVMMGYLEKIFQLGQMATQAVTTSPALLDLAKEVSDAARAMFKDLLGTYNIRNADAYLPDLDKYIEELKSGAKRPEDVGGVVGGITGQPGVPGVPGQPPMAPSNVGGQAPPGGGPPAVPVPSRPGEGL